MALYIRQGNQWKNVSVSAGSGAGDVTPIGTIALWSGSIASIPQSDGWYLCNGQTAGGVTTPDLRNRFVIGADADATINSVIYPSTSVTGSATTTGGSANAVLISHSHGTYGTESGYRHAVRAGTDSSIDWDSHTANNNDATYATDSRTDATGLDADGNASTTQTGTNANLPPYYALAYIMKCVATATGGSGGTGGTGGLNINANLEDVLGYSIVGNQLSADSAGQDKIVFWDQSETKLTYLTIGNGLTVTNDTITADVDTTSIANFITGIDILDDGASRGSATEINFGAGITATTVNNGSTTIEVSGASIAVQDSGSPQGTAATLNFASGITASVTNGIAEIIVSSTGTVSQVDVKQYSDNSGTEYTCDNPISVETVAGISTIGIGSTSNAYGTRSIYNSTTEPTSSDGCDGDIWYNTKIPTTLANGAVVDLKLYSDESPALVEYSCASPITIRSLAGISTIGIGTTSNAFGKKYVSETEPTVGVCDGDIWYDTSGTSSSTTGSRTFTGNVGVRTDSLDANSQVGTNFVGLYIGDGMLAMNGVLDRTGGYNVPAGVNALNIGPVQLDVQMTVDGTWVIV